MVSDVTLGRVRSSPDYEYGWIKSGQLRTVAIGSPSQHMWVESLAFYGGEHASTAPTASMAAYEVDSGKNPTGPRVGYTETAHPTNDMNSSSGGNVFTLDIVVNDMKPTNTSSLQAGTLQFWSNKRYGVGVLSTSGETSHGMSSIASGYNNRFYQRNGLAQPPPTSADPFASSNNEGIADFWAVGRYNIKPLAPPTGTLTPSGSITEVNPTFTGQFQDLNGTYGATHTAEGGKNMGDNMQAYQIIVYDSSNNVMWDTGWTRCSLSERLNDLYSTVYAGAALVRGQTYTQIARVQDQFDAVSPYCTPVAFTVTNAGLITLDGAPTGRITSQSPTFNGKYNHPTGLSSTHVQILLMNSNGAVVDESPSIAKVIASSAAPGTAFTISMVEAGFDPLTWGSSYYYAVRVRDSAGNWSAYPTFKKTDDTHVRSFRVNSAPNTPTSLSPSSGIIKTTRPLLSFVAADDDQDSTTGLQGWIRLKTKENIDNPTFAVDASSFSEQFKDTGWTYVASRDAAFFSDAAGSLKLAISAVPGTTSKRLRYVSTDYISVVAGETYEFTAKIAGSSANILPTFVGIFETSGGVQVGSPIYGDASPIGGSSFVSTTLSAIAPATAVRLRLGVEAFNNATAVTGNIWIDAIAPTGWQIRSYKQATYGSGVWTYQTTSAADDVALFQEYRWDAYTYDGSVYSGRATTAVAAQKSSEYSFTYALGPSVVVTTPADNAVLATSRLDVAWTAATQAKYRVVLFDVTKNLTAYDTGLITSTVVKSITIPTGTVRNNRTYRLTVSVKDASNLDGEDVANLTSSFAATTALSNFLVTGYSFEGDADPSGIIVSWDQTTVPMNMWQYYRLERVDPTGERTELVKIYSPSQTTYVDSTPASGVQYSFELSQMRLDGLDYIPSDEQVQIFGIDLPGVVISSVLAPDERRVMLHFAGSRSLERKKQTQKRVPLAGQTHPKTGEVLPAKPISISSRARWFIFQGEFELVTDLTQGTGITAQDRFDQLMALDESGDTVCVRDERGMRIFCKIDDLKTVYRRPDIYVVQITFTEETFFEVYST
jgi:hypothetical protein